MVRKLRQRKYEGKVVVLSGYLPEEHIGTYEDLGVDEIVGKPFDSFELCGIVEELEAEV